MKLNFTHFLSFFLMLVCSSPSFAQAVGDYRSIGGSQVPRMLEWETPANWQMYNGTNWVIATVAPNNINGIITIQNNDSIVIKQTKTLQNVIINAGATLSIFGASSITLTLSEPGKGIRVDGTLVLGLNLTTSGLGNIIVNTGGKARFRHSGFLQVPLENNGLISIEASNKVPPAYEYSISNTTLTNNGTINWGGTGIQNDDKTHGGNFAIINNGKLINNGHFSITTAVQTVTLNTNATGTNEFLNNGIINNNRSGVVDIKANLTNNSNGKIDGIGTINFSGIGTAVNNTGTIAPGNSPGTLTINPVFLGDNAASVEIELQNASGVNGGHDVLVLNGSTDISNTNLKIVDFATAPPGIYTIMTTSSGTFSGTSFAAGSIIPSNYSTPVVNASSITIEKLSILPVVWGNDLKAIVQNNNIKISWSTLQESNTEHFVIEQSLDGAYYRSIGKVDAQGNSSNVTKYSFLHLSPDLSKTNIYRIKQVDKDGKFIYSDVQSVSPTSGAVKILRTFPNPVIQSLTISITNPDITLALVNINGIVLRKWKAEVGTTTVNLKDIPKGMYQLNAYDKTGKIVDNQRIIKQ